MRELRPVACGYRPTAEAVTSSTDHAAPIVAAIGQKQRPAVSTPGDPFIAHAVRLTSRLLLSWPKKKRKRRAASDVATSRRLRLARCGKNLVSSIRPWETAGPLAPPVPDDQAPPEDMPPLRLMILNALADAAETIYTMRNIGEMDPGAGLKIVGEAHILDALRSLMADGLVDVDGEYVVVNDQLRTGRPDHPGTSDDDLRRYWFRQTPAGTALWEAGSDELDSYWDSHEP